MNDSCLIAADTAQCGTCSSTASALANQGRAAFLGELLLRVLTAPWRLHAYRNLNTRLVRDAFCNRDCGAGADD